MPAKPKTKQNSNGEYPVQTRLDRHTVLRLEKAAKNEGRSVAGFLRIVIQQFLAKS